MDMSETAYRYIVNRKDYLKNNDLNGFYEDIANYDWDVAQQIGSFLEENGIIFEQELNGMLPSAFSYIPSYWIYNKMVCVPPQIKILGGGCFQYADAMDSEKFNSLLLRDVEEIYPYILAFTNCEEIILGKHLKEISPLALCQAESLKRIKVPKVIYDDRRMMDKIIWAEEEARLDIYIGSY